MMQTFISLAAALFFILLAVVAIYMVFDGKTIRSGTPEKSVAHLFFIILMLALAYGAAWIGGI
jgi:hypothetical protein